MAHKAHEFTATYGYLPCTWPEVLHVVKQPHPGVFIACTIVRTIIDNLRSVESISSLDIFFSRPGLLYSSACGHLSQQIHYGKQTAWHNTECIRKHWTLSYVYTKTFCFSKICKLRHRWPMYKFLAITPLRSLFRTWLFDRWTLQWILHRSIPKTRFSWKTAIGWFFHSGSHMKFLFLLRKAK